MVRRLIIYLIIITLCSALLFTCWGCMGEGRDSGSGIWGRLRSIGNDFAVANLKFTLDGTNIFGVTDSTGYFRLDGVPSGSYTASFVRFDTIITEIDFSISDEQSQNGDLVQLIWPDPVGDSGTLSGVVEDDEGQPVAGVEITLGRPDKNILKTFTSEIGAYSFTGLVATDGYSVVAFMEGYEPESALLALGPFGFDRVNFELTPVEPPGLPSGFVKGRVVDNDGIPVNDAYVIVYPRNVLVPVTDTTGESATGPDGTFEFPEVIEGPYVLWVGKSGQGVMVQEIYVTAGLTWEGEVVLDGKYSTDL